MSTLSLRPNLVCGKRTIAAPNLTLKLFDRHRLTPFSSKPIYVRLQPLPKDLPHITLTWREYHACVQCLCLNLAHVHPLAETFLISRRPVLSIDPHVPASAYKAAYCNASAM